VVPYPGKVEDVHGDRARTRQTITAKGKSNFWQSLCFRKKGFLQNVCPVSAISENMSKQACQAAYFQTNLGKFWRVMQWTMLVYFLPFSLFYGHLVYFVAVWYVLWLFGITFPFWYFVPR
jgi:hypothetical protein